jgi:hypothetical protein
VSGLDDVIKPGATSGTFYMTDTSTNKVFSFHATGLDTSDYYASVGSLKAFGEVDPTSGAFTPVLSSNNAPGFDFSSPHGVTFVADGAPDVASTLSFDTARAGAFVDLLNGHDAYIGSTIGGAWTGTGTCEDSTINVTASPAAAALTRFMPAVGRRARTPSSTPATATATR